ncbi:MAG: TIGR03545 family protein [Nitrospinae bacterium]|nr:TIGR03545 family protein [Nitrospinota bacterium]
MKIFRWQGLVVFAVLFLLIWGFLSFYLDGLIKKGLEEEGSKILQTQIEVESVGTSLLTQSAGFKKLSVANADNLMENMVEIDSVSFSVDVAKAVQKKLVINEMSVEGIRLNQKRKSPAKAYRPPGTSEDGDAPGEAKEGDGKGPFSFGKILNPKSPEEILKSENLETLQAAEKAKQEIETLKNKWEKKLETELSTQALEDVKKKIEALQSKTKGSLGIAGIATAVQDLKAIQETIQGNLDKVKNLKEEMKADTQRVKQLIAELKELPQKDFERLKKKYSLDLKGGSNILASLLGPEIKEKIDLFWKYYEMVSPYLNKESGEKSQEEEQEYVRGKGVFVKFREQNPFPDFLIRHAKLSLDLFDTKIAGELKDFSDNQRVYGKPAVLNFSSDQDEKFESFKLTAKLDRTQSTSNDSIDLNVKSLKLDNLEAGEGARIEKGFANIQSAFKIENQKNMSGFIQADLVGLVLKLPEQQENEIFQIVADILASTDKFYIKITIDGSRENYDVNIDSDLDQIISKAIKGVVTGKVKEFEQSLKSSIFSATGSPLAGLNDSLGGLLKFDGLLGDKSSAWTGLLDKAGVAPAGIQDKLPLKNKLPNVLKDLGLPF